jgi:hypothetical protein
MGNSRARGRCSSVVGVLVAAVCLVTTAGVSAPLAGAAARSGPGASGPAPVPTFPGVKAQIVGLVDMGSQAPYSANEPFPTVDTAEVAPDATAFHGITVNIAWSQLEPEPGKFVYTDLTNSLNAVTKYNKAHPKDQLVVKLRVFGAYAAPQWAKTLDGPAINTVSSSGVAVTDGQWWQPDYEADWANLQDALAARYDTNQLIHSVAVDSCTSLTQEPFNMAADSSVLQQIQADGWTDQKQENCLIGALSDYSKWTHTSIDYAFNPFKYVQPGKDSFTSDTAITNTVMADCADSHASGGPVCILSNHGLDPAATEPSKSTRCGPRTRPRRPSTFRLTPPPRAARPSPSPSPITPSRWNCGPRPAIPVTPPTPRRRSTAGTRPSSTVRAPTAERPTAGAANRHPSRRLQRRSAGDPGDKAGRHTAKYVTAPTMTASISTGPLKVPVSR